MMHITVGRYLRTRAVPAVFGLVLLSSSAIAIAAPGPDADSPFDSSRPEYPDWSPFSTVIWEENTPHVIYQDEWYIPESIHGIAVDEILAYCQEHYKQQAQKRFAEDLVVVIRQMGGEINRFTDLVLRKNGKQYRFENVEMLRSFRDSIVKAGTETTAVEPQAVLTRRQVFADIDVFQAQLENQFAYLRANDVDYLSAIAKIRSTFEDETPRSQLARELTRVMALFIDGHSAVSNRDLPEGYLPFLLEPIGDRFLAVKPDRSGFLDEQFPYIGSIEEISIESWMGATRFVLPQASPQFLRRNGARELRSIQHYRTIMGLPIQQHVLIGLVSADGAKHKSITIRIAGEKPRYGTWPKTESSGRMLSEDIGYLRLANMDDTAEAAIREWMPQFRERRGVVIDVRGNTGGSRGPLLTLFPYLMRGDDTPHVANAAKYRMGRAFDADHLAVRHLYRKSWNGWSDAQRAVIDDFMETFRPEWSPPEEEFSVWHFMVLDRPNGVVAPYVGCPVVVLMDAGSFSATDIFLGALKGWRNVTLMGEPSGGGSARAQTFTLPRSGIRVQTATMASFRPTGQLYDGRGIPPDVRVVPDASYFLNGGHDRVLNRAIALISENAVDGQ